MKALIIVAHGSKLESSNQEIINIANKIKEQANDNLLVEYAFLELTEPSIFHSLTKAVGKKCTHIKIFPYFLAAGKHVKIDIPTEVKKFQKLNPEIKFTLLPHIGMCKGIEEMIIENSLT